MLELLAATAIAGIITAAALSATVSIHRSFSTMRKRVAQNDELRVTSEYVLEHLRLAGGGLVRPWQAISVSCAADPLHPLPACGPAASDHQRRLHLLELEPEGQGVIDSVTGTTIVIKAPGGNCPLTGTGYVAGTPVVLVPPESRTSGFGGATWLTGLCGPVAAGSPCRCTMLGVGQPGYNAAPASGGPIPDTFFAGGVMARGAVASFVIDDANGTLLMHKDFGSTGVATTTPIAPDATAFDIQFGYDPDNDGIVNALRATPDLSAINTLRTVRIGLAVATPSPNGQTITARVFGDRVGATGALTSSTEGTAMMRASGVFQ
jgi:hypothetical protein